MSVINVEDEYNQDRENIFYLTELFRNPSARYCTPFSPNLIDAKGKCCDCL